MSWVAGKKDAFLKGVPKKDFVRFFGHADKINSYQLDYDKYNLPFWDFTYEKKKYFVYIWSNHKLYIYTKQENVQPFIEFLKNKVLDKKEHKSDDSKIPEYEAPNTSYRERQKHGFDYENIVIKKYNLKKSDNYTSKYDAFHNNLPVQIKCIKHGCAIEMGDYHRNKLKKEDFILIVGFWQDKKDNIIKETILFIEHDNFTKNLSFEDDEAMEAEMDLISNLVVDDMRWKDFCDKYKSKWPKTNLLDIRFKRDHKKQKRIQCAISWKNFKKFSDEFETFNLKIN
jgi:hypothetical protein